MESLNLCFEESEFKMRRKRGWHREPGTNYISISHESKTEGQWMHLIG